MRKKKETQAVTAVSDELEEKELPEELEARDGNQTDGEEEDMLEEIDLSIPGDEEEGTPPAGAPAAAEAGAEAVAQQAAEPAEIQGPPPPAVPVTRHQVPEA